MAYLIIDEADLRRILAEHLDKAPFTAHEADALSLLLVNEIKVRGSVTPAVAGLENAPRCTLCGEVVSINNPHVPETCPGVHAIIAGCKS